ncbi:hypothetical protein KGA66_02525 [Actinocrinis puniceicyclus]|uniref:DUF1453 domain-containing protein n=1 Tax=Actinocrinis puniceicyclus TaxID=977794 RepID=A0A8J7WLG8_9ACTN|nr:hypothetical protein [Actinocrinis puniceicyclus]MBS2961907.1 hypothetical protein [Actinocrinis puniceicyclus]
MSALETLAVIGVIGYIIFRQVQGEPLRGKRAVLLPAILTVIGFSDLRGNGGHLQPADVTCLVVGVLGSAAIGLGFGVMTRLESRDGCLWAQLPLRGLWLWGAMAAWRVAMIATAAAVHAHVAASSSTLLLTLGVNRLAQAAVIVPRAMAAGVPFAPEQDGKTFMASAFERGRGASQRDVPPVSEAFAQWRSARSDDAQRSEAPAPASASVSAPAPGPASRRAAGRESRMSRRETRIRRAGRGY